MTAEVGLPVCEAIVAFGEGRYHDAVSSLHPVRRSCTASEAATPSATPSPGRCWKLRSAAATTSRSPLVSERLALREASPYNRRQRKRIVRTHTPTATAAVAAV